MFGNNVNLLVDGRPTFRTQVGGLLSLFVYCLGITISIISLRKMVRTSSPAIVCTREFNMEANSYDLEKSGQIPFFTVLDRKTESPMLPDETLRYISFSAELIESTYDYSTFQNVLKVQDVEVKKCNDLKSRKPYDWFFQFDPTQATSSFNIMHCLELTEQQKSIVSGNKGSTTYFYMRVNVHPCNSEKATCAAPADIQNKIGDLMIMEGWQDFFFRYSDYKDPIKKAIILREELTLQLAVGQKHRKFYKKVAISDKANMFTSKNSKKQESAVDTIQITYYEKFVQSTCSSDQIKSKDCPPYMTIQYESSGWSEECIRSYPEVLETISEVGGLIEIAILGISLLYTWFNDYLKDKHINQNVVEQTQVVTFYKQLSQSSQSAKQKKFKAILSQNKDNLIAKSAEKSPVRLVVPGLGGQHRPSLSSGIGSTKTKIKLRSDAIAEETIKKTLQQVAPSEKARPSKANLAQMKKQLRKLGTAIITEQSEFNKLIEQMSTCQILSEALLTEHQKNLLPIVKIEMQKKKHQKSKELPEDGSSRLTNPGCESKDLMVSLRAILADPPATDGQVAQSSESELTASINRFFKAHLSHLLSSNDEVNLQE